MKMLHIADGIAIELRLFGLIGVLEYDKYNFSAIASVSFSIKKIIMFLLMYAIYQALFLLIMCSMAIQQIITIVYLETIDQLTELLYIFGIFFVAFGKLYGFMLNRNKIVNMLDGLNGSIVKFVLI